MSLTAHDIYPEVWQATLARHTYKLRLVEGGARRRSRSSACRSRSSTKDGTKPANTYIVAFTGRSVAANNDAGSPGRNRSSLRADAIARGQHLHTRRPRLALVGAGHFAPGRQPQGNMSLHLFPTTTSTGHGVTRPPADNNLIVTWRYTTSC